MPISNSAFSMGLELMAALKLSQNGCHVRGSSENTDVFNLGNQLTLYQETVCGGGVRVSVLAELVGGSHGTSSMGFRSLVRVVSLLYQLGRL